jgi:transposase InsO family protein
VVAFTDSSDYAIGGWIAQPQASGKLQPVVFWSRKLQKAELAYAIPEKELLALVSLVEAHRPYFSGKDVVIRTDHRPLIWLQNQPVLSARQVRWVIKLQELNLKIEYLPGKFNHVADYLSRQPALSPKCSVCARRVLNYEPYPQGTDIVSIHQGPLDLQTIDITNDPKRQRQILEECHDSPQAGHPGTARTLERVQRLYIWNTVKQDVQEYVRTCDACQRSKSRTCKPLGLLESIPPPESRFGCIGMDWFSLPTDPSGYDTVMIIVDYFSKLTVLIPCHATTTSTETAALFKEHWVDRGYGIPSIIISDRDSKLTSKFWSKLCKSLGVELRLATARHQQTNGQVERTIRVVKSTLMTLLEYDSTKWRDLLSSVEFALNDSRSATTGHTPFFLTLGQHPRGPASSITQPHPWAQLEEQVRKAIHKAHERQSRQYNKNRKAYFIQPGDSVLLERDGINWPAEVNKSPKLLTPWLGPFTVLEVKEGNVRLELPPTLRVHNVFSPSKIKPYLQRPGHSIPAPDFIDGAPEYEVERILDHRTWRKHLQYLVKWKGMGNERNQWLFAEDMIHCQELINEYLSTGGGVRSGAQANQASGLKEASKRKGVSRHLKIKLNFRTEKENDQSP